MKATRNVKEIFQLYPPNSIFHVCTAEHPTDCGTQIRPDSLFHKGPEFLKIAFDKALKQGFLTFMLQTSIKLQEVFTQEYQKNLIGRI